MKAQSYLLTPEESKKVEQGEVLPKDYFYIPVIYFAEESRHYETNWHSLRFTDGSKPASLMAYASKVQAGQTLWDAVRRDLKKDFKYPQDKSFMIEEARPFDTAKTKDGRELTRLLAWVSVDTRFSTDDLVVLGMRPKWEFEGEHIYNLLDQYFGHQ